MADTKLFPMLDGPALPWPLARIIHEANVLVLGSGVRHMDGIAGMGGYKWSDVPLMFERLKRHDKASYRRLMERSREFAFSIEDVAPMLSLVPEGPPPVRVEGPLDELVVVCWKWRSPGYRVKYEGRHVNTLAKMVRRHYSKPHRFICITDDTTDIDKNIETLPLWPEHSRVPNPNGVHLPSCFRRLRLFSADVPEVLQGKRVVSLDLDVVIVGNMDHIWDRSDKFVGWRVPSAARSRYAFNGSMWMVVPGTHAHIWDKFDPVRSPALAKAASYFGSDQGWMSYCLRDLNLPGWTAQDGVYSFPREVRAFGRLPHNARIVIFHGARKPWETAALRGQPWVIQHYR